MRSTPDKSSPELEGRPPTAVEEADRDKPPPFSPKRFAYVWRMLRAFGAERKGDFDRALQLIDEAAEAMPLRVSDQVWRALILLRLQRTRDAHLAFDRLRQLLKGSSTPEERYLFHYCTAKLSVLQPGSSQWAHEAKQANAINCRSSLKARFPLVTTDEIYDRIKPRR